MALLVSSFSPSSCLSCKSLPPLSYGILPWASSRYSWLTISSRFLKVVPALAQRIVDDTNLPIYEGSIKALSDTQVSVGLRTALDVPAGLTVSLDGFVLYLYNSDSEGFNPYTSVSLSPETVKGHTVISIQDQVVDIGNRTELNKWLQRTLSNKTSDISVRGDTTAHLGALKAPIHLEKTVSINGLNELAGVKLNSLRIVLPPEADGSNLIGNFTLPNWSPLTMGLGNLTFNTMAGDTIIGNATILNVELPPGNSTREFRGQIFLDVLIANIGKVISSQTDVLRTGNIVVGITGNSTIVNGEHITYLENVLNNVRIDTPVPIIQALGDLLDSVTGENPTLNITSIIGLIGDFLDSSGPLSGLLGGLNLAQSLSTIRDTNADHHEALRLIKESVVLPNWERDFLPKYK
jgi:hypothetical protein